MQPQYAYQTAPMNMPLMASGGLASLPVRRFQSGGSTVPRYSYDPVTQRYTLLTPEQQANQMMAAQKYDYAGGGGDGGVGSPGSTGSTSSGTVGSSGTMGGIAQGVNAAVSNVQSALGPFSMAVPGLGIAGALSNMGVNQAMDVNEQADAALAAANQQANQATVTMGSFGPQVTTAVDISPVANPAAQQVTSIAPNVTEVNPVAPPAVQEVSPLAALTAMNQQQAEEENSPAAVAADVAATVAATADAVDAEGGQTVGVGTPSGVGTDTGAGAGGGGEGGFSVSSQDVDASMDAGDPGGGGGSTATGGSDTSSTGSGASDTGAAEGGWRMGGRVMNYQYGGQVMNYEQGGLAAARQAQSKGRGQDTMLVHMTPKEVGGLQALAMAHGGSLTINPKTGLPEAGFLSALLPTLIGAGLSIASGGALTPLMAAGITGLGYGAATGSLKKGLLAGLGAYGGAGLGSGLVSAATPLEATATMTPVPPSAPAPAFDMSTVSGSAGDFMAGAPQKTSLLNSSISAPTVTPTGIPAATPQAGMFSATNIPPATVQPTGFAAAQEGLGNVFKPAADGGAVARAKFGAALPYGTTVAAAAPLAMAAAEPPKGPEPSISNIRPYKLDITNPSGTPVYTPQDTREREQVRYAYSPQPIYQAAGGGLTALNGQTYDDEYGRDEYAPGGSVKKRKVTSLRGNPYYKFAQDRKDSSMEAAVEQNFAKGGLGAALPPRFLSGGGDGMSDSIKARIGGVQEARLADGEFVVPADVVSHLGNGSSKAGAKKLYAMMDKIRKARTGRTRQAPEVNARRYMPA